MEARTIDVAAATIAEHKLLIIRQQQLAAELARKGESDRARQVRAKLFQLLYQLDLMQEATQPVDQAA